MTPKATTTCRVYPDDAARLAVIRHWLQWQDDGKDKTIADTVAFLAGAFCQLHPALEQLAQALMVEE